MKISKYIAYTVLGFVALSGCSKQLDLKPTDTINENNAFRTINDAQLGANGAYGRYTAFFNDIFLSSIMSDEAKLGADNAGQGALSFRYQGTSESGDLQGGYASYYSIIDQTNRVLAALPNVLANPNNLSFEEDRRKILKGQMLALRAISHFGLLNSFSNNYNPSGKGIPIMLVADPAARPGHNTMGEVMTRIETDLADAFALLPDISATNPFTDTVMNRVNINAYRARIALYKGDYTNAVNYATIVINSGVKPLVNGSNFGSIWTESLYPTINESLFRIRNATGTGLASFFTTGPNTVYIAPSDKLTNLYGVGDRRKTDFIGTVLGRPYVKKHESARPGGGAGNRTVDLKAIRTAEMFLIRAEAYAKQASPNLAGGTADLNTLRGNRITGYVNVPNFVTAADLLNAVLEERFKELCFEGSRFFDLKRNNLPVARAASDVTSSAWQNLPAGDKYFVMPIPLLEMQANPNAVQNPGY
jgi:starch-binding outer membrane protein, SusD/RagB family